jgi:hypothetical protein
LILTKWPSLGGPARYQHPSYFILCVVDRNVLSWSIISKTTWIHIKLFWYLLCLPARGLLLGALMHYACQRPFREALINYAGSSINYAGSYYACRRPLPEAPMHYACWELLFSKCIRKVSQEILQNMIFSPINKLFTKENVFILIYPQNALQNFL